MRDIYSKLERHEQRLKRARRAAVATCLLAIAALCETASAASPATASAPTLRIEDVTIVSPERDEPMADADVTIRDGRIASISSHPHRSLRPTSKSVTIDGSGLFLTPGLIDSHVHLGSIAGMTEEQEARHPDVARAARDQFPRSFLLYGFTSLIDLISSPQALAPWKNHPTVPDTYFCGGAALMDGYPMNYVPKPARYQMAPYMLIEPGMQAPAGIDPKMHTPQAVVARMKADGAICVKAFFERGFDGLSNLPVPKLETIRALVQAAHSAGLPVLLHANSAEAQNFGLKAGVDILAHGLWNWNMHSKTIELTPEIKEILDRALAASVGWQPTMQVLYGERDLFDAAYLSDPALARVYPASLIEWFRSPEGQWFHDTLADGYPAAKNADPKTVKALIDADYAIPIERGARATAYMLAHGARILFGTDTPSAPTYANPPGLNGWTEMRRRAAAGETPLHLFRSATLVNAQAFKLDHEIGTVEVGKRADLLLMRKDPTQTLQAYAGIAKIILGGTRARARRANSQSLKQEIDDEISTAATTKSTRPAA